MSKKKIYSKGKVCHSQWLTQYYETDAMRVVHHSNYLRWLETARISYMDEIGLDLATLEQAGITSPVLHVDIDYKKFALYGELVDISCQLQMFDGLRAEFVYEIRRGEDLLCSAHSLHCFVSLETGRPLSLAKVRPDFYDLVTRFMEAENGQEYASAGGQVP